MSKLLIKQVRSRFSIMLLLVVLVLTFAGYSVTYGQSGEKTEKQKQSTQVGLFDPFSLTVTDTSKILTAGDINLITVSPKLPKSGYIISLIQIPCRPELRSPFRPPLDAPL